MLIQISCGLTESEREAIMLGSQSTDKLSSLTSDAILRSVIIDFSGTPLYRNNDIAPASPTNHARTRNHVIEQQVGIKKISLLIQYHKLHLTTLFFADTKFMSTLLENSISFTASSV